MTKTPLIQGPKTPEAPRPNKWLVTDQVPPLATTRNDGSCTMTSQVFDRRYLYFYTAKLRARSAAS